MRKNALTGLSLDKAFLGFMVLGALVFFGVTIFFISNRVADLRDDTIRSVVEVRGDHIALDIVNHLEGHWADLEALATVLPFSDKATFRSLLTREVSDGAHMYWAAYTDVQGNVLIASRQQREGENVSSEGWFQQSKAGPIIGYAQDADGREMIVMTQPIAATGQIAAGLVSFHFRPEWFEAKVRDTAHSLGLEIVAFDARGLPVLHSFAFSPKNIGNISVQNALAGQRATTIESWVDLGMRYAMSIPALPASALPTIGWRLVVLTPTDQFTAETSRLQVALSEILGAVALILLVMSVAFIRIFLVPIHRLVMNAHDIADGGEVLPLEHHRTTELSLLSSALARLQGRMLRAEDRVVELEQKLAQKPSDDPR